MTAPAVVTEKPRKKHRRGKRGGKKRHVQQPTIATIPPNITGLRARLSALAQRSGSKHG